MVISRSFRALIPILLLACALFGCGKKGALIPPEALAPAPIKDLTLAQKGDHFQVAWSIPAKQERGSRLEDLEGFLLYRRQPKPADQDCEACVGAYTELARIDLEYLGKARRVGNQILFNDFDLREDQVYQYKVRSFTTEKVQSTDSNLVRHAFLAPPLPPVLEAAPTTTGVTLSFVAAAPEKATITGYQVYRAKPGEPFPLLPITRQPVPGNQYQDTSLLIGTRYSYSVTAVATYATGEIVESLPSNRAEASILERD